MPHWLTAVEQAEQHQHSSEALGLLCNQAGYFLHDQGRYSEAEPLYIQALEIRKTEPGGRHPDTASNLFNLAALYYQTKRRPKALTHIQQAIEIYTDILGPEYPNTKAALSWLQPINRRSQNSPNAP